MGPKKTTVADIRKGGDLFNQMETRKHPEMNESLFVVWVINLYIIYLENTFAICFISARINHGL